MKKISSISKGCSVTKYGIWFHYEEASENWNLVCEKKFGPERKFSTIKFHIPEIEELIFDVGLLKYVIMVKPFAENIVREIIANISEDI